MISRKIFCKSVPDLELPRSILTERFHHTLLVLLSNSLLHWGFFYFFLGVLRQSICLGLFYFILVSKLLHLRE